MKQLLSATFLLSGVMLWGGLTIAHAAGLPPTVRYITGNNPQTTAGGLSITVNGTDFVDGATVSIGGQAATGVTFVSDHALTATAPAKARGAYDVTVTNPDAQEDTCTGCMTYSAFPAVRHALNPGGGGAAFVRVANLNGDLWPDIAAVTQGSYLYIFLNHGDGTFTTSTNYTTGASSYALAVGEFNGDSHPDIVTANDDEDTISVFLNNGDGTFASKVDYSTGNPNDYVQGIITGDFDDDGSDDIAAVNGTADNLIVFLNNGDGTFAPRATYADGLGALDVVTGDFDQDSDLDLAVVNEDSAGSVSIFLNNGDGTFASKVDYNTGDVPRYLAVADFNGDSIPDLAVTETSDASFAVFLNNGDGTFENRRVFDTLPFPLGINAGDLNRDGDADIVTCNLRVGGTETDSINIFSGFTLPNPPPGITSITGNNPQTTAGGLSITVNGTDFVDGATVSIGGQAATGVTFVSDHALTATAPAKARGAYDVTVTNPDAQEDTCTGCMHYAGTITVNSLLDDGDTTCTETKCTLRDAIANSLQGDTIAFGDLRGAIILTAGAISIPHDLSITGPGQSVLSIDGSANPGAVTFDGLAQLSLSNLTLTQNLAGCYGGGAVFHRGGVLTIRNVTFSDNDAEGCSGGAIYLRTSSDVSITGSTFLNNRSSDSDGGAIYAEELGNLTITSSTFMGNITGSTGSGGAIFIASSTGALTIVNTTFFDNAAGSHAGALSVYAGGLTTITNSTFSSSTSPDGSIYIDGASAIANSILSSPVSLICTSPITSRGSNIDSGTSCGLTGTGDRSSTDPLLSPTGPADNGGPVKTIALTMGSPAVDTGDDALAPNTDARGIQRPQGKHADIGAYELVGSANPHARKKRSAHAADTGPTPLETADPSYQAPSTTGSREASFNHTDALILIEFQQDASLGYREDAVISLQKFLNGLGFIVAPEGPGSPGHETAYFGPLTHAALIRFQEALRESILAPLNLQSGTGVLGPQTRMVIRRILGH